MAKAAAFHGKWPWLGLIRSILTSIELDVRRPTTDDGLSQISFSTSVENRIVMGVQRIWMLCLLVIAGSGPLPLWLHTIVCHGHATHRHASNATCAASQIHATCQHCHHHAQPHNAQSLKKSAKATLDWQAGGEGEHDECAVCYTLSQLTTAPPINSALVSHLDSQQHYSAIDAQARLQCWLAYSSRGPPAV